MSYNRISVDIRNLNINAEIMQQEYDKLVKLYKAIDLSFEEFKVCWQGKAQKAFFSSVSDDMAFLRNLINDFEEAAKDFEYAAKKYIQTEERTREIAAAVRL